MQLWRFPQNPRAVIRPRLRDSSDGTRISRITQMGADMVMRVDAHDVGMRVGSRLISSFANRLGELWKLIRKSCHLISLVCPSPTQALRYQRRRRKVLPPHIIITSLANFNIRLRRIPNKVATSYHQRILRQSQTRLNMIKDNCCRLLSLACPSPTIGVFA